MGASHSFISLTFSLILGLKIDFIDAELFISTPVGGIICLDHVYHGCMLSIVERDISINLIVIPNLEFDVTIGTYFFSEYCVSTDCFKRQVTHFTLEGYCFGFKGDHLEFSVPSLSRLGGKDLFYGILETSSIVRCL